MEASTSNEINGTGLTPKSVRFTVTKSSTFSSDLSPSHSHQNLLTAEYTSGDDVFEGSTSHVDLQIPNSHISFRQRVQSTSTCQKICGKQPRLRILLAVLALTIILVVVLVRHFYLIDMRLDVSDGAMVVAKVDIKTKTMVVYNRNNQAMISVDLDSLGQVSGSLRELQQCSSSSLNNKLCLNWTKINTSLSISAERFGEPDGSNDMHCVEVSWKINSEHSPTDCLRLTSSSRFWFNTQNYLMWSPAPHSCESATDECALYYPNGNALTSVHERFERNGGKVIEPTWYSSDGVAFKVSTHYPVNVCNNLCNEEQKRAFCLNSTLNTFHYKHMHRNDEYDLKYMVCVGDSISKVYNGVTDFFVKPNKKCCLDVVGSFADMVNDGAFFEGNLERSILNTSSPILKSEDNLIVRKCSSLIEKPLWKFVFRKNKITNSPVIREHLLQIKPIGGTCHVNNFTKIYERLGDFELFHNDESSFVDVIHKLGFLVMLPVTPFINYNANNFLYGAQKQFLVSNPDGFAPYLTGIANEKLILSIVDFTNTNASEWFYKNIARFMNQTKVDYMHAYFGEGSWLPKQYFTLSESLHNFGHFATLFADVASKVSTCSLSDVAYDSQRLHQFVLLNSENDMRDSLSVALAAGLAGYPFVVPAFPGTILEAAHLKEKGVLEALLIRWIEMVAFFPVMHIPWDFEAMFEDNVSISLIANVTKKYTAIRNSQDVGPRLKRAMVEAEVNSSRPVVAPMWMAPDALSASTDQRRVLLIQDQFMIGDDMFVAPILSLGGTLRTIYFPPGKWKDIVNHREVESKSGKFMTSYQVSLLNIPVFIRTGDVIE